MNVSDPAQQARNTTKNRILWGALVCVALVVSVIFHSHSEPPLRFIEWSYVPIYSQEGASHPTRADLKWEVANNGRFPIRVEEVVLNFGGSESCVWIHDNVVAPKSVWGSRTPAIIPFDPAVWPDDYQTSPLERVNLSIKYKYFGLAFVLESQVRE